MKYCVNCGNQLPDDANFCSKCGRSVEQESAPQQNTSTNSPSSMSNSSRLVWDRETGTYKQNPNYIPPAQPQQPNTYWQNSNYSHQQRYYKTSSNANASLHGGGLGFVLTFFLGLLGFILCLCLGDDDCKSAAKTTFWVTFIIGVILGVLLAALSL